MYIVHWIKTKDSIIEKHHVYKYFKIINFRGVKISRKSYFLHSRVLKLSCKYMHINNVIYKILKGCKLNPYSTDSRDKLHGISRNIERNMNTAHDVRFDVIKPNYTRKITCPLKCCLTFLY